ncbi:MAG TPA: crossover junction endodeoxyribonuclease RuvC [Candidatus Paceibacterota bacterium]
MPPKRPARVLGFDPGFERLGVAVVERRVPREELLHSECVRTKKSLPFPERLALIGEAADRAIRTWKPDAVALEDIYFEKNAKTAIQVAQVRGILCYIAARAGLPVLNYTPPQIKVAVTGHGRSDKKAVAHMVRRLLAVPEGNKLDDEMDAIAVALTCLASTSSLH